LTLVAILSLAFAAPILAENFSLFKNEVCRPLLHVGWITELAQHALDQDANLRSGVFSHLPVDGHVLLDALHEFLSEKS